MNCYGTNPNATNGYTAAAAANTYNSAAPYRQNPAAMAAYEEGKTTSFGEWSQPVPVDPNLPTSPASVMPPAATLPASTLPAATLPAATLPGAINPGDMTSQITGIPASELPTTLTQPIYTPAYLTQHIGDLMRVEFLVGNSTTDRVGRLRQVGASFIVLASLDGASEMVCDIYSIKFVTIITNPSADILALTSFTNT